MAKLMRDEVAREAVLGLLEIAIGLVTFLKTCLEQAKILIENQDA